MIMATTDFFEQIRKIKESKEVATSHDIHESANLELLGFLKSVMDTVSNSTDLENRIIQELEERINHENEDLRLSNNQMIEILTLLKKKRTEDTASVLGVLKQQIVNIQNNNLENPMVPLFNAAEKSVNDIPKEEYNKAKNIVNFIERIGKSDISPT